MTRRIVACMYLVHQDLMQFPFEAVIESVSFADEWCFVAGSEKDATLLRPFGTTHVIDQSIEHPEDISRMLNRARTIAFESTDADAVVLVQADTMSTPALNEAMRDVVEKMDLTQGHWVLARDSRLYVPFQDGWGFSIVGRAWDGVYFNDGLGPLSWRYDIPYCLHVGYLSTRMVFDHTYEDVAVWGESAHYGKPETFKRAEVVRWCLPRIRHYAPDRIRDPQDRAKVSLGPIEKDTPEFTRAIDALDLREDQRFVHDLLTREKLW